MASHLSEMTTRRGCDLEPLNVEGAPSSSATGSQAVQPEAPSPASSRAPSAEPEEPAITLPPLRPRAPKGSGKGGARPSSNARTYRNGAVGPALQRQHRAQKWMNSRLEGLVPRDLHTEDIAILTAQRVQAPAAFQDVVWWAIPEMLQVQDPDAHLPVNVGVVLVFADEHSQSEVELCRRCCKLFEIAGQEAPPMIFLPHSGDPKTSPERSADETCELLTAVFRHGVDMAISGEAEGFELACEVRMAINKHKVLVAQVDHAFQQRRCQIDRFTSTREAIADSVWTYLRLRLRVALPGIDDNIPHGEPRILGNYAVGLRIAIGCDATVHRLHIPDTERQDRRVDPQLDNRAVTLEEMQLALAPEKLSESEVWERFTSLAISEVEPMAVKVTSKEKKTNLAGLKSVSAHVAVWELLSNDQFAHPNITKLAEVMHSETHIFYLMQYGGSETLFQRIRHRSLNRRPLSSRKTREVIVQCIAGLTHMHIGPGIAHRDMKPENVLVSESSGNLAIKITDFDASLTVDARATYRSRLGTFPFSAPEVHLEDSFNPFAADIWSLGVTLLEVMCFVSFLETLISVRHMRRESFGDRAVAQDCYRRIHEHFSRPDAVRDILAEHLRPEMQFAGPSLETIMNGVLSVAHVDERWDAQRLETAAQNDLVAVS